GRPLGSHAGAVSRAPQGAGPPARPGVGRGLPLGAGRRSLHWRALARGGRGSMTTGAIGGAAPASAVLTKDVLAAGSGVAFAFGVGAFTGIAAGLTMPRGPVTNGQALALLLGCLVAGAVAGWAARARWAILLVPAVHILAFELVRIGASGPTVDLPRLDSAFGVLAFLVGRGVYAAQALAPLAVGAWLGVGLAKRAAG